MHCKLIRYSNLHLIALFLLFSENSASEEYHNSWKFRIYDSNFDLAGNWTVSLIDHSASRSSSLSSSNLPVPHLPRVHPESRHGASAGQGSKTKRSDFYRFVDSGVWLVIWFSPSSCLQDQERWHSSLSLFENNAKKSQRIQFRGKSRRKRLFGNSILWVETI